jgi:hypothetical protein
MPQKPSPKLVIDEPGIGREIGIKIKSIFQGGASQAAV